MRKACLFSYILCLLIRFSLEAREVLGWIASYHVDAGKEALQLDCGEYSPKDAITTIALQFWLPTFDGEVMLDTAEGASDEAVKELKALADSYNIKTLLCIYNYFNDKWDWDDLAVGAFTTHKSTFIKALVDEVKKYDLDGIDLDLEAMDDREQDKQAYITFVKELAPELHAIGKTLSLASFNTPCFNAPNMSWWEELKEDIDNFHTMNYSEGYEYCEKTEPYCTTDPSQHGEKVYKYSYTMQYGLDKGVDTAAISIGLMALTSWGDPEQDVNYHLQSILDLNAIPGICIWELTRNSGIWATSEVWEKLSVIKKHGEQSQIDEKQSLQQGTLVSRPRTYKIVGNTCTVPKEYRSIKHTAEVYSLQGKLIDRIRLTGNGTLSFNGPRKSMHVRLVKFH